MDLGEHLKKFVSEVQAISNDHPTIEKTTGEIFKKLTADLGETDRLRFQNEIFGLGPLDLLFADEDVSEILINSATSIWFEKSGVLFRHPDKFFSEMSFAKFLQRLSIESGFFVTLERPAIDGEYRGFRMHWVHENLCGGNPLLSFRRHPKNPWTLETLLQAQWCRDSDVEIIQNLISKKENILVVGPTSSGKTSILNACLQKVEPSERIGVLEDSSEIQLPNQASFKLLTRFDTQKILPDIDLSELLKRALRLRPDRIVLGEIRHNEAKDFLLSLSTGHAGSMGSIHAEDPQQALLRLEMLVQMGAPTWSLQSIRRLLQLSLKYIIVTGKNENSKRQLKGIHQITSLEQTGFCLEKIN